MAFNFNTSKAVAPKKKTSSKKMRSFNVSRREQKKATPLDKYLSRDEDVLVDLGYSRFQTINKCLYQYCDKCRSERIFAKRYVGDSLSSIVCINCGAKHKITTT